jgi:hypothetical protein
MTPANPVTRVTSPQDLTIFLLEPRREIVMGLEGVFMGSDYGR